MLLKNCDRKRKEFYGLNRITETRKFCTHCSLCPNISPTIKFDTPVPIICIEQVTPIAVPTVDWLTTRGIDGHRLAWKYSL